MFSPILNEYVHGVVLLVVYPICLFIHAYIFFTYVYVLSFVYFTYFKINHFFLMQYLIIAEAIQEFTV